MGAADPNPQALRVVARELVLGGQRSGKSRRAEHLAARWLQDAAHGASFIATAQAHDAEMHDRIARHRADRAQALPRMACIEAPLDLAGAIRRSPAWHDPQHLLVVDCLTLWLSNVLFAPPGGPGGEASAQAADAAAGGEAVAASVQDQATGLQVQALVDRSAELLQALAACAGPVVLVSNEIGLGVVPMGAEVRAYVDALGRLNQQVAARCERVCLMVAGLPLMAKGEA
ncbi:bifunctional adenosylcobinamide kinase/adenosylcobinamide-phosphate guanylyltransferase [Comamonas serinivorans]|uniref:bifunctional adenosylcobinamide kinase/adenosylcobinamide-phosphate guanylyltransferase n=1 Tax=Comamonas serinivorans TaxID=1082851 RepID=UPI00196BB25D|nr:bifunctional adenosylcobinamide kinase/adenosylcobinamide-phosphate guanylyltransferase [Comamonas serinivorans]